MEKKHTKLAINCARRKVLRDCGMGQGRSLKDFKVADGLGADIWVKRKEGWRGHKVWSKSSLSPCACQNTGTRALKSASTGIQLWCPWLV